MAESMQEIMNPGATPAKDPGFPSAPEQWSRDAAELMARDEGLNPTEDHWEAVRALQDYFGSHERINMRELHDALEERFHARGGMKHLYGLFPGGPVAQGGRIAGLEVPAGAADASFGSVQ